MKKANELFSNGKYEAALSEYLRLQNLFQSYDNPEKLLQNYRMVGECHLELGNFPESISSSNQYYKCAKKTNSLVDQQRAMVTLGRAYLANSALKKAEDSFIMALDLSKKVVDFVNPKEYAEMQFGTLLNLGIVYECSGNYPKAVQRFEQCMEFCIKHSMLEPFLSALAAYFDVQARRALYETALHKYNEAIVSFLGVKSAVKHNKNELLEKLALIHLACENFRHSAKLFRKLVYLRPKSSLYKVFMKKGLMMDKIKRNLVSASHCESVKYCHEKLGDMFCQMHLYSPAVKHYEAMLVQLELARSKGLITGSDYKEDLIACYNSLSMTYRDLKDWSNASMYCRKEVDFHKNQSSERNSSNICRSLLDLIDCKFEELKTAAKATASTTPESVLLLSGNPKYLQDLIDEAKIFAHEVDSNDLKIRVLQFYEKFYSMTHNNANYESVKKERERLVRDSAQSQQESCPEDDEEEDQMSQATNQDEALTLRLDPDIDSVSDSREEDVDEIDIEALSAASDDSVVDPCQEDETICNVAKRKGSVKRNEKGESALHVAVLSGQLDIVKHLVEKKLHPVNIRDNAGWLPIHDACNTGHHDVVLYLLDHGAWLEDPGPGTEHSTPLLESGNAGDTDTILELIKRGANLWHRNAKGENLADILTDCKRRSILAGSFGPEEEKNFKDVMEAIKEHLGDSYNDWLRSNKGPASKSVKPSSSMATRRRHISCSDEEDDAKENSTITSKSKSNPVDTYQKAILGVGRSAVGKRKLCDNQLIRPGRSNPMRISSSEESDNDLTSLPSQLEGANKLLEESRWIVEEESPPHQNRRKTNLSSPQICRSTSAETYDRGIRQNKRRRTLPDSSSSGRLSVGARPLSPILAPSDTQSNNSFVTAPVAHSTQRLPFSNGSKMQMEFFTPPAGSSSPNKIITGSRDFCLGGFEDVLSSTRIEDPSPRADVLLNRRSSKTFPAPVVERQPNLNEFFPPRWKRSASSEVAQSREASRIPKSMKITYLDISVIIPIQSDTITVDWLTREAEKRFSLFLGRDNLHLLLTTSDGALLMPTDQLFSVLSSNTEHLCAVDKSTNTPSSATNKMQSSDTIKKLPSGPSSLCSRVLDEILQQGVVRLMDLSLSNIDLFDELMTILKSDRNGEIDKLRISEIRLSGNRLNDQSIESTLSIRNSSFEELFQLCRDSIQLIDLSSNSFTATGITKSLRLNFHSDFSFSMGTPAYYSELRSVNLSYTMLCGESGWMEVIFPLLKMAPKLNELYLKGCLFTGKFVTKHPHKITEAFRGAQNLHLLDLSWSPIGCEAVQQLIIGYGHVSQLASNGAGCVLKVRGCLPLPQYSVAAEKRSVQRGDNSGLELICHIHDFIRQGACSLSSLDLGHWHIDDNSLKYIENIFCIPNNPVCELILDANPLGRSVSSLVRIIQAACHPCSQLSKLTVNLPKISSQLESKDLLDSIQSKLQTCFTPIQELTFISRCRELSSFESEFLNQLGSLWTEKYCHSARESRLRYVCKFYVI